MSMKIRAQGDKWKWTRRRNDIIRELYYFGTPVLIMGRLFRLPKKHITDICRDINPKIQKLSNSGATTFPVPAASVGHCLIVERVKRETLDDHVNVENLCAENKNRRIKKCRDKVKGIP